MSLTERSAPDDRLREPHDLARAEPLLHRLLLAEHALVGQHLLCKPRIESALDDLGHRLFGLALLTRQLLEVVPGTVDQGQIDLVLAQCGRLGEGDVQRDLMGQFVVRAGHLEQHTVGATTVLHV